MSPSIGRSPNASQRTRDRLETEHRGGTPVALWRDPWAWACVLAVIPLVLHSLGAPLGEPVADDFDHLHHALFSPRHSWLEGGGSATFWRPLAYQGYYGLLAPIILARPGLVVALHIALLAATALLLYRTLRRFVPGPWAAAIATFPLFAESTRALITVPVHFVDLGLLFFSALAFHEAACARLATSLMALLAALLCKESAVATAALLPFLARVGAGRGVRRRWLVGAGLVTLIWGLTYLAVRARHHLTLPSALGSNLGDLAPYVWERYGWAVAGSLRAIFSLPAASAGSGATREAANLDLVVAAAMLLLVAAAVVAFARDGRARARLVAVAPVAAIGLIWSAIATAPLLTVYPIWSPQRVAFGSIGLGAALAGTLGAAHPTLLAGLVALRLALFAWSPAPPTAISMAPNESGAWVDFERLVRLQRLMGETRALLRARYPRLPTGAVVVQHNLPHRAYYAFGGNKAIQVWYRDSTLRWLPFGEFRADPSRTAVAVVEWQPMGSPQVAIVEPAAMRALIEASDDIAHTDWPAAIAALDRADSLQPERAPRVFLGTVAAKRALCLIALGREPEVMPAAREGLRLWPANPDSRYAMAQVLLASGRAGEAIAQLDTLLWLYPDDAQAAALRERARQGSTTTIR